MQSMKQIVSLMLLVMLTGCQIDVMDPARGRTIVPDTEAKLARKLFLDSQDERKIRIEERYNYDDAGQLNQVERFTHDNNGTVRKYSFDLYSYTNIGQVARITQYSQTGSAGSNGTPQYQVNQARYFSYPMPNQIVEQIQYIFNGAYRDVTRADTRIADGKPTQVNRYGFNDKLQPVLQTVETYRYENGRLTSVEYRDATGKLFNTNLYEYKGRTATVSILYHTIPEPRPYQLSLYDGRGRLIRQTSFPRYDTFLMGSSSTLMSASSSSFSYSVPYIIAYEYLD